MELKRSNGWENCNEKEQIFDYAQNYKEFITNAKTEKETCEILLKKAKINGFKNLKECKSIKSGDKIYFENRNQNLLLAIIGEDEISKGLNFIVSHMDAPRLDLKPNPLHVDGELAFFKTHYYGGVKKYQWGTMPLALHGEIVLNSGEIIKLSIGEKDDEPVFIIPDILPHLDRKIQRDKKSPDILTGEQLQIIVGSTPYTIKDSEVKSAIKYSVLKILNEQFGIIEEDFNTAELKLVPAGKARDVGFDKSLIAAYGQDDRICGYTSATALFALINTKLSRTAVCFLADKEEIGSTGRTGLSSNFLEYFVSELIIKKEKTINTNIMLKTLWSSMAISADVTAGMNPLFKNAFDKTNSAKLNYGLAIAKYTGHGGKSGASEASLHFYKKIRKLLNDNNINWQTSDMGKVDEGGGGTVAHFLEGKGIDTIDAGAPLLSMHSPYEIASKFDIYQLYKAYKAFFELK